jgi:Zn-dependent protease with chaperone function
MKQFKILTIINVLLLLFSVSSASIKDLNKALDLKWKGKLVSLRASPNVSGVFYFKYLENDYVITTSKTWHFPNQYLLDTIIIEKISYFNERNRLSFLPKLKLKNDYGKLYYGFKVHFTHKYLGDGWVSMQKVNASIENEEEFDFLFSCIFKSKEINNTNQYIVNNSSNMIHYIGGGHLPPKNLFEKVKDQTKLSDYSQCKLCFNKLIDRRIALESILAKQMTQQIDYNPSINTDKQESLNRLGNKVLDRWPVPLRGYDYSFNLTSRDSINARAIPGGSIYINQGLLDIIENEEELEFVLAHEIAHIELSHGLLGVEKAKKDYQAAVVAAAIFGGVAAASSYNGTVDRSVSDLINAMTNYGFALSQSGYSRAQEREADIMAMLYMKKNQINTDFGKQLLGKLRFSNDLIDPSIERNTGVFYSHPTCHDRIYIANNLKSEYFPANTIEYNFKNKDEYEICRIKLLSEVIYKDLSNKREMYIKCKIDTTDALEKDEKLKGISFNYGNKTYEFKLRQEIVLFPRSSFIFDISITKDDLPYRRIPKQLKILGTGTLNNKLSNTVEIPLNSNIRNSKLFISNDENKIYSIFEKKYTIKSKKIINNIISTRLKPGRRNKDNKSNQLSLIFTDTATNHSYSSSRIILGSKQKISGLDYYFMPLNIQDQGIEVEFYENNYDF